MSNSQSDTENAQSAQSVENESPTANGEQQNLDDDSDQEPTCCICMESYATSGEHRMVTITCGHHFGESCIRRWELECLQEVRPSTCPLCIREFVSEDISYDDDMSPVCVVSCPEELHALREMMENIYESHLEIMNELYQNGFSNQADNDDDGDDDDDDDDNGTI